MKSRKHLVEGIGNPPMTNRGDDKEAMFLSSTVIVHARQNLLAWDKTHCNRGITCRQYLPEV